MLGAHTVRRLKPGTFEPFVKAFGIDESNAPAGWVRFNTLRSVANENEVVTFGLFAGTLEELEHSQATQGYGEQRAAIDEFVEEVAANGVYDNVVDWTTDAAAA